MQSKTRQPGRDRNATGVVDGSDQGAPDVIRHRRISLRPECRVVARAPVSLTAEPDVEGQRPAFVGARLSDAAGRVWQELNLAELASEEAFLRVVG